MPSLSNPVFFFSNPGEVSAKKFSGYVLAIATSAMKFCRLENRAAHFFSEEIADGNFTCPVVGLHGDRVLLLTVLFQMSF